MTINSVGGSKSLQLRLLTGGAIAAMSLALIPANAHAAGTLAGTAIKNTATATYDDGSGTPKIASSNEVTLTVDELLDVTVASTNTADVPTTPGATDDYLTFTVTNNGNGSEAFRLGTIDNNGGDDYSPTATQMFFDTDNNGVYDVGTDLQYTPGTNDPVLAPDASVRVFVVATTPPAGTTPGTVADGNRAQVLLTAESVTVLNNGNNNTPGTTLAGLGAGGSNAVVGATGADSEDDGFFRVSAASVTLQKSAVVADQFGGTDPVPGASITYTIVATVSGSGSVSGLTIGDQIPAGTTYRPGTIWLGGVNLTDATGDDAGQFASNTVTVTPGVVPGGETRTLTFTVRIN